jgi:phytoene synthase
MTTDPQAAADPVALQAQVSGSSFYAAMRVMPKAERAAMFAIYSFCRMVDDIADDGTRPRPARATELDRWRADLGALYAGRSAGRAEFLKGPVRDFGLQQADFLAVVDGMEMDVDTDIRAPDLETLNLYCDRVAVAVGRLSIRIFGMEEGPGLQLAHRLGRALQLTNILRDLDEDAQRGRLYLPREILERHGIRDTDPAAVLRHPALPAVCRDVAQIALGHFDAAEQAMGSCSRRAMRPAATMGAFYRAMLDAMLRDGWRDPAVRVSLSKGRKLWLVLRHALI